MAKVLSLNPDGSYQEIDLSVLGGGTTINSGVTTLNFGTNPGNQRATVTITGQTLIDANSRIKAYIPALASADHNIEEHVVLSQYISLSCSAPTPGTGFDIHGFTELSLTGLVNVIWEWY